MFLSLAPNSTSSKPKDWLTPRPVGQLLLVIAASFCGVLPGPSYLVRSAEQLMLYAFSRSVCPSVHSYVANIGWMLHTNAWYVFFLSCLSVCLSQNKECPVKAKSWTHTHTQNFILRNYVGILAQMLLLLLLLLLQPLLADVFHYWFWRRPAMNPTTSSSYSFLSCYKFNQWLILSRASSICRIHFYSPKHVCQPPRAFKAREVEERASGKAVSEYLSDSYLFAESCLLGSIWI